MFCAHNSIKCKCYTFILFFPIFLSTTKKKIEVHLDSNFSLLEFQTFLITYSTYFQLTSICFDLPSLVSFPYAVITTNKYHSNETLESSATLFYESGQH